MSRRMREEMERWKDQHPEWRPGNPLFPQIYTATSPIAYDQAYKWLRSAIEIATTDLVRQGVRAQQIDRWLAGDVTHGWRDHWATLMDRLGYGWDAVEKHGKSRLDLHNHVAFMGDWAVSGGTQAEVYAKLHPGILLAIAEFERAEDVVRQFSREAAEDVGSVLDDIYGDDEHVIPIARARG